MTKPTTTKNLSDLATGDVVLAIEDTTFNHPITVAVNDGGFVKSEPYPNPYQYGPRMICAGWPTGAGDTRTCTVVV